MLSMQSELSSQQIWTGRSPVIVFCAANRPRFARLFRYCNATVNEHTRDVSAGVAIHPLKQCCRGRADGVRQRRVLVA